MKKYSLHSGNSPIVSLLANCYAKRGKDIQLFEIIRRIKSDEFKGLIAKIRSAPNKTERDKLKVKLPAFIVTGSLAGKLRAGNPMEPRSGYVCIDLDKLSGKKFHSGGISSEAQDVKDALSNDPFCAVAFLSPSGDGVKAFFKLSNFNHLVSLFDYLEKLIGFRPDEQCKDVVRLCFFSHDSEIFVNPISEDFSDSDFASLNETEIVFVDSDSIEKEEAKKEILSTPSTPSTPSTLSTPLLHSSTQQEREISTATLVLEGLKVKKLFEEKEPNLAKIYEKRIARNYEAVSGKRNKMLIDMLTFCFGAVGEVGGILFAEQFFDRNQSVFSTGKADHMKEAKAHWVAMGASYTERLEKDEREVYESLDKSHQEAFRICRDFASRENAEFGNPIFPMGSDHLAHRVSVKPMKGYRILQKFKSWKLLEIVEEGERREKGKRPKAAIYRWNWSVQNPESFNKKGGENE